MGVNVNWNCSFQSPSGYSGNPSVQACHSGPCQSTMPNNPYGPPPNEQQYASWGTQTTSDGSTYCVEPALPGTTSPGWDRQGGSMKKFKRGKKVHRQPKSSVGKLSTAPHPSVLGMWGPCSAAETAQGMVTSLWTCGETPPNGTEQEDCGPPGSTQLICSLGFLLSIGPIDKERGGEVSGVQRFKSGGRVGRSRLGHPIKKR